MKNIQIKYDRKICGIISVITIKNREYVKMRIFSIFINIKMTSSLFEQIKIVLVETSHTGNMGSAARAMKTMGLTQLCLVNPITHPDTQSISLAAGANDVINHVEIVKTLNEAIADCHLVIGTSARLRSLSWPHLSARECGYKIMQQAASDKKIALVFGRERIGLTNDELQKCHYHVSIPANPDYSSLNLAMSVQILCYEIRQAMLESIIDSKQNIEHSQESNIDYPTSAQIEGFYQHFEKILLETEFINPSQPGQILGRLRRLFNRANIEEQELNILRGVLTSIGRNLKK